MKWDYFISHASEDKDAIAQPLASYLSLAGFRVWYDEFSLKLGDSLLQSIDAGLSGSKFGIAILSQNFFSKKWPKSELSGLFSLETGKKRILPVWHEIDGATVARFSPILADRVAVSSERGLHAVASAVIAASFPKRNKVNGGQQLETASQAYQRTKNEYRDLLGKGPSTEAVKAFLRENVELIAGPSGKSTMLVPEVVQLLGIDPDFVAVSAAGMTGPITITLAYLASIHQQEIPFAYKRIAKEVGARVPPSF